MGRVDLLVRLRFAMLYLKMLSQFVDKQFVENISRQASVD